MERARRRADLGGKLEADGGRCRSGRAEREREKREWAEAGQLPATGTQVTPVGSNSSGSFLPCLGDVP